MVQHHRGSRFGQHAFIRASRGGPSASPGWLLSIRERRIAYFLRPQEFNRAGEFLVEQRQLCARPQPQGICWKIPGLARGGSRWSQWGLEITRGQIGGDLPIKMGAHGGRVRAEKCANSCTMNVVFFIKLFIFHGYKRKPVGSFFSCTSWQICKSDQLSDTLPFFFIIFKKRP